MISLQCACQTPVCRPRASQLSGPSSCRAYSVPSKSSFLGNRLGHSNSRIEHRPRHTAPVGSPPTAPRQVAVASVFGVGAPEAILVGVVALVVFGPKGLAEAAKSLGTSLRGFAPTIRELAGVSNELKQTLEQEIGLDEIRREWRDGSLQQYTKPQSQGEASGSNRLDPKDSGNSQTTTPQPKEVTDETAAQVDPDIASKRADSARLAWGEISNTSHMSESHPQNSKDDAQPSAKTVDSGVGGMSIEELEAELARRRSKQSSGGSKEA